MRRLILPFLMFIALASWGKSNHSTIGWKAGTARITITPEQSMWMAGYAARTKPAEGKLHDLWAKALFLEDSEENKSLLITTDLIGFSKVLSDRICNKLEEKMGLSRAQIILNSSHTHSGPVLTDDSKNYYPLDADQIKKRDDYSDLLVEKIIQISLEAERKLKPVNLFAQNGVVRFQVNRRNNQESKIEETTELKGPNDFAVPVLKVENKQGKTEAIVFGYACHATVLNGYEWSGDYPGFAQIELEKKYKGATAMFFQGAGADQNPLPRRSIPLAEQYGKELASAVNRVLNEKMTPLTSHLKTAYSETDIRFAHAPPTAKKLHQITEENSGYPEYLKLNAHFLLEKVKNGKKLIGSYPYPVQVWKMGEHLLISLGGELLTGYAIRLKKIYGNNTFVLGYSNDVMAYIPTAEVLAEGGYEGTRSALFTTPWSSDIEEVIINKVAQLVSKLEKE
ncbi:hypothetical protein D1164_18275 [Mariniphaga sediminis]|uniref:Neutral/alkaline non-lysosomal ceramidase N-terminal domain-containing protein n=1 Tax=Mariniphaga sediminis TaxID=1628158 RepID=A0A399CVE7_9BACT|nr:neutral/alkaline non-lysosomal ceramidase N-terminal domain-containing protein [Mariniphaga sediminis]RIH63754.1 hypothetical protein D1164_18275 [Mariniphaga sediminis]